MSGMGDFIINTLEYMRDMRPMWLVFIGLLVLGIILLIAGIWNSSVLWTGTALTGVAGLLLIGGLCKWYWFDQGPLEYAGYMAYKVSADVDRAIATNVNQAQASLTQI